jgi:carboxymethylenebutenolidase
VIVQEIFGVNSHIQRTCDGFAADGYVALAPALFDRVERDFATGYAPADIERGRAVRAKLTIDQAVVDVRAAARWPGRDRRGGR